VNGFTRASSPMRLAEYAACGVPIVSTELPECRRLGPDVRLAPARVEDFEREIEAALAAPREVVAPRLRARADELRWSRVVRREVLPALAEAFGS
jgi:glycosyltransferase involved in cell wall biosynthesis